MQRKSCKESHLQINSSCVCTSKKDSVMLGGLVSRDLDVKIMVRNNHTRWCKRVVYNAPIEVKVNLP